MSVQLYLGDCLEVMRTLDENSIDTCITDPPYELGFMGKRWDSSGVAFQVATWEAVYRVLKPGAILLAFGGTRTYHRMVCAIEDAGFEIRDTIAWVYGSGFPKSLDIGKAIDKQAGAEREVVGTRPHQYPDSDCWGKPKNISSDGYFQSENKNTDLAHIPVTKGNSGWDGWGTALKPAHEPIVVAMKPIDGTFVNNALTWGVAGLWIDGGRVEVPLNDKGGFRTGDYTFKCEPTSYKMRDNGDSYRKDQHPQGRFPANFIHDGSDEVVAGFPMTKSGLLAQGHKRGETSVNYTTGGGIVYRDYGNDSGSAARFFYCAKASRSERNAGLEGMPERDGGHYAQDEWSRNNMGNKPDAERKPVQNHHPTVKPISLMRYLVRLTKTPTGGVVLDPFMGSGTTGCACALEGRDFIGIEREQDYFAIAEKRIAEAQKQPKLEAE